MENRKFVVFLFFLLFPISALAYEADTTHRGLTADILRLYEDIKPGVLSSEERLFIEQGSVDEDEGLRALNHFYDPVHDKGVFNNLTAKDWAMNTKAQRDWDKLAWIWNSGYTLTPLFVSPSDYSWERNIYEFIYGSKERGLKGLGHILHLMEDMAVPDHTRDDPHPPYGDSVLHQASPYEHFANKFDRENIYFSLKVGRKGFVECGSIGECLYSLALYSNKNFFSKDSILSEEFNSPEILFEKSESSPDGTSVVYGYNGNGYRLVKVVRKHDLKTGATQVIYSLEDARYLVLSDYWNHLGLQAVSHGARVVELFFEAIEEEKKTKEIFNKNKSPFQKWFERTVGPIFGISKSLYGSSVDLEDLRDELPASVAESLNESPVPEPTQIAEILSVPETPAEVVPKVTETQVLNIKPESLAATSTSTPAPPSVSQPPLVYPGFGGGGGGTSFAVSTDSPSSTTPTTSTTSLSISSPADGFISNSTSVTFSGTSTPGASVFDGLSTTTSAGDGTWSINHTLAEGTTTLSFEALASGMSTSTSVSRTVVVDTVAPTASLSISECSSSLRPSPLTCLLSSNMITLDWSASSGASYFKPVQNGTGLATTSLATTSVSASLGVNTFQVVAYDSANNAATSSTQTLEYISTIGFYIDPYTTSFTAGGSYTPTTSGPGSYYISPGISGTTRYGDLYRGTVGSSTLVNGHNLGSAVYSVQLGDDIGATASGTALFAAIFEVRSVFPTDLTDFRTYFTTGTGTLPHTNYSTTSWLYGP